MRMTSDPLVALCRPLFLFAFPKDIANPACQWLSRAHTEGADALSHAVIAFAKNLFVEREATTHGRLTF
jgi:hypothetical protein